MITHFCSLSVISSVSRECRMEFTYFWDEKYLIAFPPFFCSIAVFHFEPFPSWRQILMPGHEDTLALGFVFSSFVFSFFFYRYKHLFRQVTAPTVFQIFVPTRYFDQCAVIISYFLYLCLWSKDLRKVSCVLNCFSIYHWGDEFRRQFHELQCGVGPDFLVSLLFFNEKILFR